MKIKRLSDIIKEDLHKSYTEGSNIEIELIEDERFPKSKKAPKYSVNYQKEIDGEIFEIEGTLHPKDTGRNIEYYFEPNYYTDEASEIYYDENWEDIEDEILKKFNERF